MVRLGCAQAHRALWGSLLWGLVNFAGHPFDQNGETSLAAKTNGGNETLDMLITGLGCFKVHTAHRQVFGQWSGVGQSDHNFGNLTPGHALYG